MNLTPILKKKDFVLMASKIKKEGERYGIIGQNGK
jgi:hypothetical protein